MLLLMREAASVIVEYSEGRIVLEFVETSGDVYRVAIDPNSVPDLIVALSEAEDE
jgi:hypothetical protein